ncbi:hypothetical protein MPF19_16325 [Polaribacter sp. Z014]|uniref:hypothetical protein n=1 Tax=unclassified Polaribacter TaxID=196858 RepID=UPI00193B101E|nr:MULTISPECIES: hypothetical protein [unclassified Polaribacter]MCL7764990.1 hypothetical protein [Polaribacter sp. Z014]QVY64007.1 hypothetical protein JOP69_09445 [Polaribacter sp. Q13]
MKKLILTVAVAILSSGISISAANINNNINSGEVIVMTINEDFKEVALEDLPEAVSNAILKDYATAIIGKAYVNGSEQYKIELTIDETETVVYADKEGNWLKEEDVLAKKVD